MVVDVGRDALYTVIKIAAPVMLTGLFVGLIIALFQALTTIQEITLTFVPKILFIFLALIVFLPFMITTLTDFSNQLFDMIANMGGGGVGASLGGG